MPLSKWNHSIRLHGWLDADVGLSVVCYPSDGHLSVIASSAVNKLQRAVLSTSGDSHIVLTTSVVWLSNKKARWWPAFYRSDDILVIIRYFPFDDLPLWRYSRSKFEILGTIWCPPNGRLCVRDQYTITRNFTPIGVNVAEISVTDTCTDTKTSYRVTVNLISDKSQVEKWFWIDSGNRNNTEIEALPESHPLPMLTKFGRPPSPHW